MENTLIPLDSKAGRRQLRLCLSWYHTSRGAAEYNEQSPTPRAVGLDTDTQNDVAIKLEHVKIDPSFLSREFDTYREMHGRAGIPQVYWYGEDCEYRAMAFELLGPSLEDLFNFCNREFSLKTVLMIADQLIARLQLIHSRNIIHRDIKPENLLMGTGKLGNITYVTDLGLAWSDHAIMPKKGRGLMGTARYASIHGHLGEEQSQRDDLESLGYVLLYFIRGSLPWQGLKATATEHKEELILAKKRSMSTTELCHGLPKEFSLYFKHVRSLQLGEQPNYRRLRKTFSSLFHAKQFEYDNVFDWTIRKFLFEKTKKTGVPFKAMASAGQRRSTIGLRNARGTRPKPLQVTGAARKAIK
ncbi:MAG: hypothetical protein M1828_002995 [Chrysothrix sp. TS-e1954]|nr:MAG: hypothetical protein M1828_002995 [Chrysothrix sp. TS-e1954]